MTLVARGFILYREEIDIFMLSNIERNVFGVLFMIIGLGLFIWATADLWWRLLVICVAFLFFRKGFIYLTNGRSFMSFIMNARHNRYY